MRRKPHQAAEHALRDVARLSRRDRCTKLVSGTLLIIIPLVMAALGIALILSGRSPFAAGSLLAIWGLIGTAAPVAWWTQADIPLSANLDHSRRGERSITDQAAPCAVAAPSRRL